MTPSWRKRARCRVRVAGVGEALARVDAQREKLSSRLSELEATERVLARYSTDRRARKTASAKILSTATTSAAPRSRRRPRSTATRAAAGDRTSQRLGDQV